MPTIIEIPDLKKCPFCGEFPSFSCDYTYHDSGDPPYEDYFEFEGKVYCKKCNIEKMKSSYYDEEEEIFTSEQIIKVVTDKICNWWNNRKSE